MSSVKAFLGETVGRLFFRELTVTDVRSLSPRFRAITLGGDSLRGDAGAAGDKVQVLIAGTGETRTYTPFSPDRHQGSFQILTYDHGDEPGARWARTAAAGDKLRAFGPRGSLALTSLYGPVVLFGDETSFAVTAALIGHRGGTGNIAPVYEVSRVEESTPVLRDLGVPAAAIVQRVAADRHLSEVEAAIRAALVRMPRAHLVLTGKAQSIQALRAALRSGPAIGKQLVKPYWSVGKRGLD